MIRIGYRLINDDDDDDEDEDDNDDDDEYDDYGTEIMRILAETGSYVELFSVKFVEMIGQFFINPCSSKCTGWLAKALSEVMHKDRYCNSVSFSFSF